MSGRRGILWSSFAAAAAVLGLHFGLTLLYLSTSHDDWARARAVLFEPRGMVLAVAGLIWGVARAAARHPRFVPSYARWLLATPWTPGQPLPLGPVRLAWEDAVAVAAVAAVAVGDAGLPWAVVVVPFVFGYGFTTAAAAALAGYERVGIATAFAATFAAPAAGSPWAMAGVVAAVLGLGSVAAGQSLRGFPWRLPDAAIPPAWPTTPRGLGWPLNRLAPRLPGPRVTPQRGWAAAAFAGWAVFVALHVSQPQMSRSDLESATEVVEVLSVAAAVARLLIYTSFYWPPIGLLGRFVTGRWVVPGYDHVVLPPLVMAAIGFGTLPLLARFDVPPAVAFGLVSAAVVAVGLNAPPTFRRWRTTGHHRMFAGTDPNRSASNRQRARLTQG